MSASTSTSKRMQREWKSEAEASKKARGPRKVSVPVLVSKAIDYNCKNMSPQEIDHIFIGGLSLRQRVQRDKQMREDKHPEAPIIGKLYWEEIRGMYMDASRLEKQMEPDESLPLSRDLMDALAACLKGHPNRSLLQSYMSSAAAINQRELVLLLRYTCKLEPSASSDQLSTCVAVMEGLYRLQSLTKYPVEMAVMRPKFDQIATQACRVRS